MNAIHQLREEQQRLHQAIWEEEQRIASVPGYQYRSPLGSLERQRRMLIERIDLAERRAVVERVLRPPHTTFSRGFLQDLNEHAIRLVLEHRITVKPSRRDDSCASQERRTIRVAPVLSEVSYAVLLHEAGHLAEPLADGRQYFYDQGPTSIASPPAEIQAWKWALRHALCWTLEMQSFLSRALGTYRAVGSSTGMDLAIDGFIAAAFGQVQPAPDSLEAALRKSNELERQHAWMRRSR